MYWDSGYWNSSYWTPFYWDGDGTIATLIRKITGMAGVGIAKRKRWGKWR